MSDMEIADGESAVSAAPIDISELDVDSLSVSEAKKLPKKTLKEISERVVAELFRDLGVDVVSNLRCFEACVRRISQSNLFSATQLTQWGGYRLVRKMAISALEAAERQGKIMVLPAHHLIAYWVAMDIRKLKGNVRDEATRILRILDAHRHVVTAIQVFSQHQDMFFVDVKDVMAPNMTGERLEGYPIVQAVSGSPNRWTTYMTFGNGRTDDNAPPNNPSFESIEDKFNATKDFDRESTQHTFGSTIDSEIRDGSEARVVKVMVELTREEVMASAGDLFSKLDQPWLHSDQDLTAQVDSWISNDRIALLDETNRGILRTWCDLTSHPWAERIKALPKSYYSILRREKEQVEPKARHQDKAIGSQPLSPLSKLSGSPAIQEQRASHTDVSVRLKARSSRPYRQPLRIQSRTSYQSEAYSSPVSSNARRSRDAFNEVSWVADKMRGAVEQLGIILEDESRKHPRAALGDEPKAMPSLHFNALISLFHALGNEDQEDVRAALAEFCNATNMSSRQRERVFSFL